MTAVILDQTNVDHYVSLIRERIIQQGKISVSIESESLYCESESYRHEERETFPSMRDAISSLSLSDDR